MALVLLILSPSSLDRHRAALPMNLARREVRTADAMNAGGVVRIADLVRLEDKK